MRCREDIFDEFQKEICSYCESVILGCNSCSSTFICEGSHCDEAIESWYEDDEEGIRVMREQKLKRILGNDRR